MMENSFTSEKVIAYNTVDGTIIAFLLDCPKIVGKGKTKEDALDDLIKIYRAILKTVQDIQKICD